MKNILEFEVSEFWKTSINQSWLAKRSQENFEKKNILLLSPKVDMAVFIFTVDMLHFF